MFKNKGLQSEKSYIFIDSFNHLPTWKQLDMSRDLP